MSRTLIILGLLLVVAGVLWPWLGKLGLGRLPGDFVVRREGFTLYAPIATGILISIVLSVVFWLLRR
jgi:multisubunit Na+/H+ antiporter MnhG subunit